MLMRKRPLRGETYFIETEGMVVTVLIEKPGSMVEVILPSGKLSIVPKVALNLPTINTEFYEKLDCDKA